ncbi:hypothetical protein CKO_03431 [Citrobacter koseri ATCC BAA-895]|uniref:Uncharacterized protein n=1 Tax=Citrobacter koseri (strain ATCC BAA-895 / CDC 4225-83 / SGSC4696) TaxID=290338 RepID=A8ALZ8_CITK8|nr:hypothetical protein CKO_03431 [Citrobacter koseri ATCC BAA-895]
MSDFSIVFTFTETGYSNRLQSGGRGLILNLSLPLYHIIRAIYETSFSLLYRWCSPRRGREK